MKGHDMPHNHQVKNGVTTTENALSDRYTAVKNDSFHSARRIRSVGLSQRLAEQEYNKNLDILHKQGSDTQNTSKPCIYFRTEGVSSLLSYLRWYAVFVRNQKLHSISCSVFKSYVSDVSFNVGPNTLLSDLTFSDRKIAHVVKQMPEISQYFFGCLAVGNVKPFGACNCRDYCCVQYLCNSSGKMRQTEGSLTWT